MLGELDDHPGGALEVGVAQGVSAGGKAVEGEVSEAAAHRPQRLLLLDRGHPVGERAQQRGLLLQRVEDCAEDQANRIRRLLGGGRTQRRGDRRGEVVDQPQDDLGDDRVLVGVVLVEAAGADAGLTRDPVGRRVPVAAVLENASTGAHDALDHRPRSCLTGASSACGCHRWRIS